VIFQDLTLTPCLRCKLFYAPSNTSNRWVTEERNLYEDYKNAFGEEPPMVSGVAIMTDTDNTGESATAYYGDIFFKGSTKTAE